MSVVDVTGMRVDVELAVAAPADVVWDLVAEITNVGAWSPECVHAAWLDDQGSPRPGARFSGRNRVPSGFEWTVSCVVTEASRPLSFAWVVLDDSGKPLAPSSRWRYDLEAAPGGGTLVRHSFVHGPGDSGLRWMMRQDPDDQQEIMDGRRKQLRQNMLQAMTAMKAAAEHPPR